MPSVVMGWEEPLLMILTPRSASRGGRPEKHPRRVVVPAVHLHDRVREQRRWAGHDAGEANQRPQTPRRVRHHGTTAGGARSPRRTSRVGPPPDNAPSPEPAKTTRRPLSGCGRSPGCVRCANGSRRSAGDVDPTRPRRAGQPTLACCQQSHVGLRSSAHVEACRSAISRRTREGRVSGPSRPCR